MTKRISFGGIEGELAEPSGPGKVPGVVLVHEWWGLNDQIRHLAEQLGDEGFRVVAPDLYHGKITRKADEAKKLMNNLDTLQALGEIGEAAKYLVEHAGSNGKVGVLGFSMGGALSFASACHLPGLSAVVAFYGVPPAEKVDYAKVTAPVMAHIASRDEWASIDSAEAIKKQLEAGNHPMVLHTYDAEHAFVNDAREGYDEESATLAWERTIAFFKEHLD